MYKNNILSKFLCGAISGIIIMQCPAVSAIVNTPAIAGFSLAGIITAAFCVFTYHTNKGPKNEYLNKETNTDFSENYLKNRELSQKGDELPDPKICLNQNNADSHDEIIKLKISNETRRLDMIAVMSALDDKLANNNVDPKTSAIYLYAKRITAEIKGVFESFGMGDTNRTTQSTFTRIKNNLFEGNKTARNILQSIGENMETIRNSCEDQITKQERIENECFTENNIDSLTDAIYDYFKLGDTYDQLKSMEQLRYTISNRYQ